MNIKRGDGGGGCDGRPFGRGDEFRKTNHNNIIDDDNDRALRHDDWRYHDVIVMLPVEMKRRRKKNSMRDDVNSN